MSEDTNETQDAPVVDANKQKAQDIFDQGHADKLTRDQIIVAMVQGGLSLNYAQNNYKAMAKDAGIETIRGGHKAEALQLLSGAKVPADEFVKVEVRQNLRKQLQEKFGVAESTANDYLKAYAKANDIELPGGGGPTSEMAGHIFDWVMANQNAEKPAFKEFMETYGRSKGNIDENWRGVLLARKLLVSDYEYTPVVTEEVPETEDAEAA